MTRADGANERRFELDDTFDKSQYLSTVNRLKQIIPFKTLKGREQDLIAKAGDRQVSLGGKSAVFYNTFKKTEHMQRLEKSVPKIDK